MRNKIRIAVVEDDPGFRRNLAGVLNSNPDWQVVAEFADALSAVQEVPKSEPDLILLDIRLPGISGVDALPQLKRLCAQTPIVILTVEDRPAEIVRALEAGASAYLLKGGTGQQIKESVSEFLEGGASMSPGVARRLIAWFNQRKDLSLPAQHGLTDRQAEILRLAAKGKQQGEIALALCISLYTVKNHFRNIYEKLGVDSLRAALIKVKNGRSLLQD